MPKQQKREYTEEQKAKALDALKASNGDLAGTARELDIPKTTLAHWAEKANVGTYDDKKTSAARAAKARIVEERKAELAADLLESIIRLNTQMFSKQTVYNFGGQNNTLRTAEVDEPSPSDKKHLATSLAILIDKLQLLTGGATQRTEETHTRDEKEHKLAEILPLVQVK